MKRLLVPCLIAFLFGGGTALAAETLSDPQLDLISAGAVPICAGASSCNISSSTTTTNTAPDANGVLHTTTMNTYSCAAGTCTNQVTNDGNSTTTPCTSCSDTVSNPKNTNSPSGSTVSIGALMIGNSVPFPPIQPPGSTIPPIFLGG